MCICRRVVFGAWQDYVHIINRLLPDDVRIITWTPVEETFSARFSCSHRTYRYFFLKEDLDVDRMKSAAQKYLGEHDYRNFCKMDIVGGVTNFKRNILSVGMFSKWVTGFAEGLLRHVVSHVPCALLAKSLTQMLPQFDM